MTSNPATTKIATAYDPEHDPGMGRLISIRRDNTVCKANRDHGRFIVAQINKSGTSDGVSRFRAEQDAIDHVIAIGYTDVVRMTTRSSNSR
jgi:hypothetical protein